MTAKTDDGAEAVGGVILALGFLGLAGALIIWGGFVLQQLWNWYGAPLVHVRLGLAQAIGVQTLISWVKGYSGKKSDDPAAALVTLFVWSGVILLIGWAAHHWVAQ